MKTKLLIAAFLLSVSCSPNPSLADVSSGADDAAPLSGSRPVTTAGVVTPGTASLAAPLRPAIATPAVAAPKDSTTVIDQTPRRHLRIGLPGLFHVNLN